MAKKLNINVKRVTGTNENGQYDFLSFYTYDKNNEPYTVKFTKQAMEKIENTVDLDEQAFYTIVLDAKQANVDTKDEYLTIWVRDFISFEKHTFTDLTSDDAFEDITLNGAEFEECDNIG